MTEEPDWRDRVTAAFLEREGDGVGAALQQARVGGNSDTDAAVLERADALLAAYDPVPHLLRNDGDHDRSPAAVEEHLRTVTGLLAADRTLLMAALYSPLALVAAVDRRHGGLGPHRQWIAWCWTVEAVWWCVARVDGTAPDGFTATELDILLPVAARQRCVAFTEAYRSSGGGPADRMAGTAPRVFGTGTAHLFVARSVEARRAWVEFLDQYESHIALGRADPSALEREVTALLFGGGRRGPLLGVSSARLHALATGGGRQRRLLERDDRRIAHDLAEHHLLPRFRLWDTLRVAAATAQRPRFGLLTTVATAAAALAMPLLVAAAPRWPELAGRTTLTLAAAAAGLCCLLGVVGIVAHGRMWALPWLLRMPAAAAIGLFMLTAMHPSWWHAAFGDALPTVSSGAQPVSPPLDPSWVAVLLGAAAYAYLITTARNNGIAWWAALARALVVWLVGALHALMVSLLGLAWVVPVFSEDGAQLAQGWAVHGGPAVVTLAQATAWCLAAGVFSQILWDDRPITAPLTHTRWRKDR